MSKNEWESHCSPDTSESYIQGRRPLDVLESVTIAQHVTTGGGSEAEEPPGESSITQKEPRNWTRARPGMRSGVGGPPANDGE